MNLVLRATVLTFCLAPYVYFGVRDVLHHKHHRPVSLQERLLHFMLGLTLVITIPHAYLGHTEIVLAGLMLFLVARALDEFVFHRGLSGAESDLHAKTHLGFLIFVVGVMGMDWIQAQRLVP